MVACKYVMLAKRFSVCICWVSSNTLLPWRRKCDYLNWFTLCWLYCISGNNEITPASGLGSSAGCYRRSAVTVTRQTEQQQEIYFLQRLYIVYVQHTTCNWIICLKSWGSCCCIYFYFLVFKFVWPFLAIERVSLNHDVWNILFHWFSVD